MFIHNKKTNVGFGEISFSMPRALTSTIPKTTAVDNLNSANEAMRTARSKFINVEAKNFIDDMVKVTEKLIEWIPTQGGQA